MSVPIREVLSALETLAPTALAESWDNVGLLIGETSQQPSTVFIALDVTPATLEQAAQHQAQLMITHHPLIFSGMKRLVEDGATISLVTRMVRDGRSLISLHTNLDVAPNGLNTYVATALGLRNLRPLMPTEARPLLKLIVYVPASHIDAVRTAICNAGAGHIGHYEGCTFTTPGTGTFCPKEGTNPFIGQAGKLEQVDEIRLETVVPKAVLGQVLSAMFAQHPYEEVAFDLLPMENSWPGAGMGRVGRLEIPTTVRKFRDKVSEVLKTDQLLVSGDDDQPVRTVALCTGAGGDYLSHALRAKADLYLTGEMKHHQALLAGERGIAAIVAGHFATERLAVPLLADFLQTRFPALQIIQAVEVDPLHR